MNEEKVRQIWYGNQTPGLWRKILAAVFKNLVFTRKWCYQKGFFKKRKLKVPVIVIGNITAGGGGKTPMVIWLVNHLKSLGYKPGIISRGYGGKRKVEPFFVTPHANPAASGDEPLLMAKLTNVPVMVGKNRFQAGHKLISQYGVNIIVSDDGMQHYALQRDIEIIMLDGTWKTGNNMFIPAGPLREPLERLTEADLVIHKGISRHTYYYSLGIDCIYALNHVTNKKQPAEFRNQKIHAIAGIANPSSFFRLLASQGLAVIKKPLPDHHIFEPKDFEFNDDLSIIITEKDAVKCHHFKFKNVWVARLKVIPTESTITAINELLSKKIA